MYNLNHYRLKWSFKLFLVINVLSKATFSLHILCRLWMTILSLFSYWLVKGFWSWDDFYTPGWISTAIVVIFETAKCVTWNEDDESHLYSFYTSKANRNLRRIANDLLDYGPPRIFDGGVIAIDSKYNTRCLTDLRNRHTYQRNARRKVKQLGRPRKTRN